MNYFGRFVAVLLIYVASAGESYAAVDSYRYLHVNVDTPWTIFLFLLVGVLAPFILMGILAWRFAERKGKPSASSPEGDAE